MKVFLNNITRKRMLSNYLTIKKAFFISYCGNRVDDANVYTKMYLLLSKMLSLLKI